MQQAGPSRSLSHSATVFLIGSARVVWVGVCLSLDAASAGTAAVKAYLGRAATALTALVPAKPGLWLLLLPVVIQVSLIEVVFNALRRVLRALWLWLCACMSRGGSAASAAPAAAAAAATAAARAALTRVYSRVAGRGGAAPAHDKEPRVLAAPSTTGTAGLEADSAPATTRPSPASPEPAARVQGEGAGGTRSEQVHTPAGDTGSASVTAALPVVVMGMGGAGRAGSVDSVEEARGDKPVDAAAAAAAADGTCEVGGSRGVPPPLPLQRPRPLHPRRWCVF
jgi:hypothetical protein